MKDLLDLVGTSRLIDFSRKVVRAFIFMAGKDLFRTGAEPIAMLEFTGNGSGKVLHDRPGCVRAKFVAACVVEFFRSSNQRHVAVANQTKEIVVGIHVLFGNRHNQTQIGLNDFVFDRNRTFIELFDLVHQ